MTLIDNSQVYAVIFPYKAITKYQLSSQVMNQPEIKNAYGWLSAFAFDLLEIVSQSQHAPVLVDNHQQMCYFIPLMFYAFSCPLEIDIKFADFH